MIFRAALFALLAGTALAQDARRSGYDDMTPELQAMQRDDTGNPAMLWVRDGEALWSQQAGAAQKSCAECHGDAAASMRGVAARHPAFDAASQRPVDLAGRIGLCRRDRQRAGPLARESDGMLALAAYVAFQSRGLPVAPPDDARLMPFRRAGGNLFKLRQGQLALSCANCHDGNAGRRLGGSVIPQAHPTGYPLYRLEWQAMGSLQRRLRNCLNGIRAEPFPDGAEDYVNLELFLMSRAAGMAMDAPGVRP